MMSDAYIRGDLLNQVRNPDRLLSYHDFVGRREHFERQPGVYAWYFRRRPGKCRLRGCIRVKTGFVPFRTTWRLLYVGRAGMEGLASRVIDWHFDGSTSRPSLSTLRMSLACLLGYQLVVIGPDRWGLLEEGSRHITRWMHRNARVLVEPIGLGQVSDTERLLISTLNPPLNLEHSINPYVPRMKRLREKAKRKAVRING